jgi:hypothetical protein
MSAAERVLFQGEKGFWYEGERTVRPKYRGIFNEGRTGFIQACVNIVLRALPETLQTQTVITGLDKHDKQKNIRNDQVISIERLMTPHVRPWTPGETAQQTNEITHNFHPRVNPWFRAYTPL